VTLETTIGTRVQLCGPLIVERQGSRLEDQLPGRQGRYLFAYLVLNRHRSVGRGELLAAIWPDQSPSAGESALNALISKIRRALGPEAITGRGSLQFALVDAWVDVEAAVEAVHRAESAMATGEHARAWGPALVALFIAQREFLPGAESPWVTAQRHELNELHVRALEAYVGAGVGVGGTELAAAVRAGRQLVKLAPLRESGYQLLMRALADQGNPGEALRVYTGLCQVLREELGVPPSAATRALYDRLLLA
jgi:SARP family transcriptional regulator, regulator of embCAB operon